jgi:hypothetical protein
MLYAPCGAVGSRILYAMMCAMPKRNPARPGEKLKNVLVTLDEPTWQQYKTLMRSRGTSASARLRLIMRREVRRARGELHG